MVILQIIFEFFKIGLFSVGGGYATIPFLYRLIYDYGWYTSDQLTNMIAVSMLTPGPVGANMATFSGYQTCGLIGGVLATISLVMPCFLLVIPISKVLKNFRNNFYVDAILYALKPVGCGLLVAVEINFIKTNIISIPALAILLFLFLLSFKFKKNPLFYILIASCFGILFQYLELNF